jgi:preprotein translocase subunit YajC
MGVGTRDTERETEMTTTTRTLKVGDKVTCNGGFPGTVVAVCEWSDSMVKVRLARGTVCVDEADCQKVGS